MQNYPIYILDLDKTTIVFPEDKVDLDHCEFWEKTVHKLVADYHKVTPAKLLKNLPYCQRRVRVVGCRIYYGEQKDFTNDLLQLIRQRTGDPLLEFYFDVHERRLKDDVRRFRGIVRRSQAHVNDNVTISGVDDVVGEVVERHILLFKAG